MTETTIDPILEDRLVEALARIAHTFDLSPVGPEMQQITGLTGPQLFAIARGDYRSLPAAAQRIEVAAGVANEVTVIIHGDGRFATEDDPAAARAWLEHDRILVEGSRVITPLAALADGRYGPGLLQVLRWLNRRGDS